MRCGCALYAQEPLPTVGPDKSLYTPASQSISQSCNVTSPPSHPRTRQGPYNPRHMQHMQHTHSTGCSSGTTIPQEGSCRPLWAIQQRQNPTGDALLGAPATTTDCGCLSQPPCKPQVLQRKTRAGCSNAQLQLTALLQRCCCKCCCCCRRCWCCCCCCVVEPAWAGRTTRHR